MRSSFRFVFMPKPSFASESSNILRITVTGICFEIFGEGYGGKLFHDVAGWLMMPVGLALLWLELVIFARLFIATPVRYAVRSLRPANPAMSRVVALQGIRQEFTNTFRGKARNPG